MSTFCWGANRSGELGLGETFDAVAALEPRSSLIVDALEPQRVSVGQGHTLILDVYGDVWALGRNSERQLGLDFDEALDAWAFRRTAARVTTPTKICSKHDDFYLKRVSDIYAGDGSSACVTTDGTLYEWGFLHEEDGATTKDLAAMPGLTHDRMSDRLKTLLKASAMEYISGRDDGARIDESDADAGVQSFRTRRRTVGFPVLCKSVPSGKHVVDVALGYGHTLVLTHTGEAFAKGYNGRGQLGTGTRANSVNLRRIIDVHNEWQGCASQVCAGNSHSIVVTRDGRVFSFGSNALGQLGITSVSRTNKESLMPTLISQYDDLPNTPRIARAACGDFHTVLLEVGGKRVFSFGQSEYGAHGSEVADRGDLAAGARFAVPRLVSAKEDTTLVWVGAGTQFSIALDDSGKVHTWGWNSYGVLGHGPRSLGVSPRIVEALWDVEVSCVSVGHDHVFVLCPCDSQHGASFASTLDAGDVQLSALEPGGARSSDSVLVHECMLHARCPLLFQACTRDKHILTLQRVVRHRVLRALIEYVCTDKCDSVPVHRIADLLKLAHEFQLPHLAKICVNKRARRVASIARGGASATADDAPSTFSRDMLRLLSSGNHHDVSLLADADPPFGRVSWGDASGDVPVGHTAFSWKTPVAECAAHRCVLERFEFFRHAADFASADATRISLRGWSASEINTVLRWMYGGNESGALNPSTAGVLLAASSFFVLQTLGKRCEALLSSLLRDADARMVEDILDIAIQHDLHRLSAEARAAARH